MHHVPRGTKKKKKKKWCNIYIANMHTESFSSPYTTCVIDMSGAYEGELKELRLKLVEAERKLTRGNADLEAKIRDLERHR